MRLMAYVMTSWEQHVKCARILAALTERAAETRDRRAVWAVQ